MKRKLKESPDFWSKDVASNLDGVSLVYKSNPLSIAKQPKPGFGDDNLRD